MMIWAKHWNYIHHFCGNFQCNLVQEGGALPMLLSLLARVEDVELIASVMGALQSLVRFTLPFSCLFIEQIPYLLQQVQMVNPCSTSI
jgi:hypothetical protein